MFEVWLQMSDTNIDTENPSDLPALLPRVYFLDTLWVENFNEITLFCTVKANLSFSILDKNSKRPPYLWRGKFFENCQEYIS